jgi:transcriptional repressor NrdR
MKCPYCGYAETQVRDSRPVDDNLSIRRRRYCPSCDGRFTTFERTEMHDLIVIKADGRKEPFALEKIRKALMVALVKRPFTLDDLEQISQGIRTTLEQEGNTEITSRHIGEVIMKDLKQRDPIGYVRFASVYRNFKDFSDFERVLGGE